MVEADMTSERLQERTMASIPERALRENEVVVEWQPQTALGRRLWEIRQQIIATGEPLLSWDDLERELAERRGGIEGPER